MCFVTKKRAEKKSAKYGQNSYCWLMFVICSRELEQFTFTH
jgi:hypothetical protein